MPMVGFGTWQLGGAEAEASARSALEVGYRHIDTAMVYGNESQVGRALRDSGLDRGEVFLTTKLPPGSAGREREAIAASLRALGTDYVDLWLIHWPPSGGAMPGTWRELLAIRDQGLTRAVGVSNYSLAQLDELIADSGEAPSVNQIPWSPRRHDPELLEEHHRRGVVVEGYSPLKNTRLRDRVLTGIAQAHGVTPAQVVLRWHLEHGIPVLPRSSRPERIQENFDLFDFSLSEEEVAQIDAL
ncbi:MAG TPA: aldo/keto reductase [Actinomycetota bacterium]